MKQLSDEYFALLKSRTEKNIYKKNEKIAKYNNSLKKEKIEILYNFYKQYLDIIFLFDDQLNYTQLDIINDI